ncbi:CDP-diacylglycerol--glycerol-3-phosphate 3-phosphatidyltransferase [uncultured Eubacterium sp.]|uniref:CDP-diacylglycerol--glycerol-3-phosphate 3-phosphatidyltransferase n=1 Tax=uncultured Eubacterium sp. TaxID=165185 RepID=UPI0015ABA7D9|nr:CDP-diacylglycerol--glycerol-3-phosphate 3-phosphatidyltransferase [uncultured Eubacterium sp.]
MNLPNKITVFRFCCIPFLWLFSLWQFRYHWVVALLVYFVACVSDTVDGNIARKKKLVTDFGKLMDPLSDKALVLAAFLIQINLGVRTDIVIMIMMAREFLVAGMRMSATVEGEVIAANVFGKAKTFIQMATTGMTFLILAIMEKDGEIIIATNGFNAPHWLTVYCTIAFWIAGIVTALSGIKYTMDGWHYIKTK